MQSDVWLVTGGAGYIGSHTVARLHATGRRVVVYDNFSSGLAHRLPEGVPMVTGEVEDERALAGAITEHGVTGVIHFAALKSVPESVVDPLRYYRVNVGGMTALLSAMVSAGARKLVLSSTAAVYGIPPVSVVSETTPAVPINPYGHSKLVCEHMVQAAGVAHGISWLALRYFNAVGAESPLLADRGKSNLFPLAFDAYVQQRPVLVTGGDFDTHDGTGVRDYIHVSDLADVHVAAVEYLAAGQHAEIYNVGTGKGYSVLDVVKALEEVTGQPVPYEIAPRRPGDPAQVVASVERIRAELGWSAKRDLIEMVRSAWEARNALEPA